MAGVRFSEEQLRLLGPHTFAALQKLVMSMADVAKNAGKTGLFGRNKGQEAYSRFLAALKVTVQSMVLDGVIRESTPTEEVLSALEAKLDQFSRMFPNWQDAYGFAAIFLGERRVDALATVERLRGLP